MTGERRSDASTSRPPDAAGPATAGIWVALSAFVSFVVTGPFLWVLALVPGALGALAGAWAVHAVRRRARRTGKGTPADVVLIILAGLLPAILLYGLVVIPTALETPDP